MIRGRSTGSVPSGSAPLPRQIERKAIKERVLVKPVAAPSFEITAGVALAKGNDGCDLFDGQPRRVVKPAITDYPIAI
jgi:hypothetical protein